jgi:PIN domain nuclease of toxin-antitoxin system
MILLDTQIIYSVVQRALHGLPVAVSNLLLTSDARIAVSVVSLWEIVIKWRLKKLDLLVEPGFLPGLIRSYQFELLLIDERHVLAEIAPELEHRDPFDRLLLGVCAAEGMKLLTIDLELVGHPLAWREG